MPTDISKLISEKRARLSEIETLLQKPDTPVEDQIRLNQEYKESAKQLEVFEKLHKLTQDLESARALVTDPNPEIASLAQAELEQLQVEADKVQAEFDRITLPKFDHDDNDAILEIRSGTGGTEAALFAAEIMRMYSKYIQSIGLKFEIAYLSENEEGGIKEAICNVDGHGAFGKLRFESGVHRVQRVPQTEANGRIHTSAISVVVMPKINPVEVNIRDQDLRIDVYRSSGPGGQSVNTTDSAVRITHIPTNIVVTCQDGKSQLKNKAKAMEILVSRLYAIEQEKINSSTNKLRADAIKTGDRSAKIRTYNFPQGRITDHRTKDTWYSLSAILEGNSGEMIETVNYKLRTNPDMVDADEPNDD